MAESVELVFLGWEKPLLKAAAQWLLERFSTGELGGGIDLSKAILVAPGRRFARQLIGELAEIGEKRGMWLSPGRIITPGEFCGLLLGDREGANASALFRGMAWGRVLRELNPTEFELLLKQRPEDSAASEWLRLGVLLDSTVGELARELIQPGEIPARSTLLVAGFQQEASKWEVIERLRVRYLEVLNSLNATDAHQAHMQTIRQDKNAGVSVGSEIVLVGIAELDKATRTAMNRSSRTIHSLVFAPQSAAESLDAIGCVRHETTELILPLEGKSIEFAEDFEDAAARAIGRIAAWSNDHAGLKLRHVSVCVPDSIVMRELRMAAEDAPGVEFHNAAGTPIGADPVVKLLASISEYLRQRTTETLARLVKHPEVERIVGPRLRDAETADQKWIRLVDEAGVIHPGAEPEKSGIVASLAAMLVDGILKLRRENAPISEHLENVFAMLERVFGEVEIEETQKETFTLIGRSIAELRTCQVLLGPIPGWRAIELLLVAIEDQVRTDDSARGSIEALGWLEAAVDHAPFMVIVGLNEGIVPRGRVEDSLLPERVRRDLGMATGETRAARDAFLMRGLLCSRKQGGQVWAIVSKKDAKGNPLKPSRFVFACDDDEVLARLKRFTSESPEPARYAINSQPAGADDRAAREAFPIAPQHAIKPPAAIHATAFADYISSPYVFFLKHVARLKEVQESSGEVDPMAMGIVIHDVLKGLKGSGLEASTDADALEGWALAELESQLERMPAKRLAAVRQIQIEAAKRRLRMFARVQATHAADGWRVIETEWKAEPPVVLNVTRGKVELRGQFDRLDQRGEEWLVLDYKTNERAEAPERKHKQKNKGWINLQLPLYAAILRLCGKCPAGTRVGYFSLPKTSAEGCVAIAKWTPADFDEAEAKAKEIVEAVLRGEFELGDDPREGGAFARLCGISLLNTTENDE